MSVVGLSAEQLQMVIIIDHYALGFPPGEDGEAQLLQGCYDYMEAFKRVMDSATKVQFDYICQQYDGFWRFTRLMEMLAEGISSGVIEVPKAH